MDGDILKTKARFPGGTWLLIIESYPLRGWAYCLEKFVQGGEGDHVANAAAQGQIGITRGDTLPLAEIFSE